MSKNKKNKTKNGSFIITLSEERTENLNKLSMMLDYGSLLNDKAASDFVEFLIEDRLADCESELLDAQLNKKLKASREEQRTKLLDFAKENDLYDPIFEMLDDVELIRVHLMLRSTMKNSAVEKLCSQYLTMYDGMDMVEIGKNVQENIKSMKNYQTEIKDTSGTEENKETEVLVDSSLKTS